MAKITKRIWLSRGSTGHRVRKVAWGYTVTVNGKREREYSSEWTKELAEQALAARRLSVETKQVESQRPKSFGEVVEEYLAYKGERGKRSLREDRRILKTKWLPHLGVDTPITSLTTEAIACYEKDRTGVSPYTVTNELSVLRHLLRLSRRWGYIKELPDVELPEKPSGRRRYLMEDAIARLVEACERSKNPHLASIVVIALNTGMRKGEILGLEWERVDFARGVLVLHQTKNGEPREVPMNQAVYDALRAIAPQEGREGPIFRKRSGATWGQIRTAFTTALKKAGIIDFRFHDLRHTCASHLVMSGASLKDVQEILGHKDFRMTLRYSHLSPAHLRGAVARLDGRFGPPKTPVDGTQRAQSAKMDADRLVSPYAPVAQVDRAAVS